MQDSNDEKKIELKTDPQRELNNADATGIYIRAKGTGGRWSSFDIAQLDRVSVLEWLRSHRIEYVHNVVLALLNHR